MPAVSHTRASETDLVQIRRAIQSLDFYLVESAYKLRFTPAVKTSDYTALLTDDFLAFDTTTSPITLSLPAGADTEGSPYIIKLVDAKYDLTIEPDGTEEIEGDDTLVMDTTGEAIWITYSTSREEWMVH